MIRGGVRFVPHTSGSMMDTVPYDRYLHIEFTHGANELAIVS